MTCFSRYDSDRKQTGRFGKSSVDRVSSKRGFSSTVGKRRSRSTFRLIQSGSSDRGLDHKP